MSKYRCDDNASYIYTRSTTFSKERSPRDRAQVAPYYIGELALLDADANHGENLGVRICILISNRHLEATIVSTSSC